MPHEIASQCPAKPATGAGNPDPPSAPRPSSFWQFSLRTLLIVVTAAGVWLAIQAEAVGRQRAAIAALMEAGVSIHYDYQLTVLAGLASGNGDPAKSTEEPIAPLFLRGLFGDDYFRSVAAVTLDKTQVAKALPHLKQIPSLKHVYMWTAQCATGNEEEIEAWQTIERELPHVQLSGVTLFIVG